MDIGAKIGKMLLTCWKETKVSAVHQLIIKATRDYIELSELGAIEVVVWPTRVYLLDFCCSVIQIYVLLSPYVLLYFLFIS